MCIYYYPYYVNICRGKAIETSRYHYTSNTLKNFYRHNKVATFATHFFYFSKKSKHKNIFYKELYVPSYLRNRINYLEYLTDYSNIVICKDLLFINNLIPRNLNIGLIKLLIINYIRLGAFNW